MLSPTADQVKRARAAAEMTQGEAAKVVHANTRSWQKWENGERKMHPAMWELFQIKTMT